MMLKRHEQAQTANSEALYNALLSNISLASHLTQQKLIIIVRKTLLLTRTPHTRSEKINQHMLPSQMSRRCSTTIVYPVVSLALEGGINVFKLCTTACYRNMHLRGQSFSYTRTTWHIHAIMSLKVITSLILYRSI